MLKMLKMLKMLGGGGGEEGWGGSEDKHKLVKHCVKRGFLVDWTGTDYL